MTRALKILEGHTVPDPYNTSSYIKDEGTEVFVNPSKMEMRYLPKSINWIADDSTKEIFVWESKLPHFKAVKLIRSKFKKDLMESYASNNAIFGTASRLGGKMTSVGFESFRIEPGKTLVKLNEGVFDWVKDTINIDPLKKEVERNLHMRGI